MLEGLQRAFLAELPAIYRDNYRNTHLAALRDTFDSVLSLVGPGHFDYLAGRYIDSHDSTSGDLNDYGSDFADFLAGASELPYLPDIARLDWARMQALLADWKPQDWLTDLLALPPERWMAARVAPAACLLASRWPLHAIWQVAQGGDGTVELDAGGESVLVSRTDQVLVTRLDGPQAAFAAQWLAGATLEQALAAAPNLDLPAVLRQLAALGAIHHLEKTS